MMPLPILELTFDDDAGVQREIRDNLVKGRTFVAGAEGVRMREACELLLRHPKTGEELRLEAEVVWVQPDGPGKGVGLELREVDAATLERFAAPFAADSVDAGEDEDAEGDDPLGPARPSGRPGAGEAKSVHERIRGLSMREQVVVARTGSLTERVALERLFGAAVWENLLSNPQLTTPEISRIAKKGNLPRPLLASICANRSWLTSPEVQRALLSNPRLDGAQLSAVLRALSRADLQRVPQQTAYRFVVRDAAKKMLK